MRRAVLVGVLVTAGAGCGADPGRGTTAPISPPGTATPAVSAPPTFASAPATTPIAPPTSAPAPATAAIVAPPSAPVAEPGEGDWRAISGVVDGAPVRLHGLPEITLTIEGPRFFGTAACNGYEWTDDDPGPDVAFTGIAVNDVGCEPAVTELQDRYLGSAGPTATYSVQGDRLTWRSPTATWEFERILPSPLVGPVWVLNGITDEFGSMSLPGIDAARIEFFGDGGVHGSTGCRTFGGEWTVDGTGVVTVNAAPFGECTGLLPDVDAAFVSVLAAGFTGQIDRTLLSAHPTPDVGLDFVATPVADDDARHLAHWQQQEPPAYSFVYTQSSMCSSDSLRVHVVDGAVASAEPLELGCGMLTVEEAPTIDDVFARLAALRAYQPDEVAVTWDADAGFPAHVQVDESWQAFDEEYGFGITEFIAG